MEVPEQLVKMETLTKLKDFINLGSTLRRGIARGVGGWGRGSNVDLIMMRTLYMQDHHQLNEQVQKEETALKLVS